MNTGSRVSEIKFAQNKMCIVHTIVCVQCINYRIILTGNVLTSRKICTVEQPHSSLEKVYLAGTGEDEIISYLVDLLTKLGLMFGKTYPQSFTWSVETWLLK